MKSKDEPADQCSTPEAASERIKALACFRHEVLRFLHFSKEAAEQMGLTAQQYQAMLLIKGLSENGRMSIGELAEKLFTTHHATVELVNRMEAAGLVSRHTEEWDKRRVLIELTREGETKLLALVDLHINELSHSALAKRLRKLSPS